MPWALDSRARGRHRRARPEQPRTHPLLPTRPPPVTTSGIRTVSPSGRHVNDPPRRVVTFTGKTLKSGAPLGASNAPLGASNAPLGARTPRAVSWRCGMKRSNDPFGLLLFEPLGDGH